MFTVLGAILTHSPETGRKDTVLDTSKQAVTNHKFLRRYIEDISRISLNVGSEVF